MRKAIVTLAVGDPYIRMFDEHCRKNWQQYCDAFGYDLIVLSESLDSSARAQKRSPSWQKLLILSQEWSSGYDRIVWADADIIMNTSYAYDISDGVPLEKVGAVEAYSIPSRELHDIALARLYKKWSENNVEYIDNMQPQSYYTKRGIPGANLHEVVQAGVFVCSPKFHKEIFEYVYDHYEDTHGAAWNYEMPVFSYELLKANMVHWISPRFNFVLSIHMVLFYPDFTIMDKSIIERVANKVKRYITNESIDKLELMHLKNIYELSIFMHFASRTHLLPKMKQILLQQ